MAKKLTRNTKKSTGDDLFAASPAPARAAASTKSDAKSAARSDSYTASDIELLQGLEQVRRRAGT